MELELDFDPDEPQTLAQYNQDLEQGSAGIERGEFTTATDLKVEAGNW